MGLTLGGISAIAFAVALAFMFKKMAKRTVVYLMLVAGLGLGGLIGTIIDRIVGSAVGGAASASNRLFGAAVGGFIVVALLTIFLWPHIKPKGAQPPTKATPLIALAYASVLVAAGGVFSTAAGMSSNIVTQAADFGLSAVAAFVGGFGSN